MPQVPLRLQNGPQVERLVAADLARCLLAVYPVGAYYGPVLEQSGDRSITELQIDMALSDGRNGALTRIVWIPPGTEVPDPRQRRFIQRIREELPSKGFEIVERSLGEIETHITDRLERPHPSNRQDECDTAIDQKEIYLLCLPSERDAARAVRDCLFAEGFEVKLPPAKDESAAALHMRRLESSDAFLVFWGSGDESWVETALNDLKKAKGLRKGKPILSKRIFLADPPTDGKLEYRTHQAASLPGFSPTLAKEALKPLLAELRRAEVGGGRL